MGHRAVVGLKWAQESSTPGYPPMKRRKGAKANGLRFERDLGAALGPQWQHGKWFKFSDLNGLGMCQPDYFRVRGDCVEVLECKYTWTPQGRLQILELYKPILEHVFKKPVRGAVVCKVLTPHVDRSVCWNVDDALAEDGVWHWLGLGVRAGRVPKIIQLEGVL